MPRVSSEPLPSAVTTGQIARLLGMTERVIAGRKADGRLPTHPEGGIDLREIVRAGVDALAVAQASTTPMNPLDRARTEVLEQQRDRLALLNAQIRGESIQAADLDAVVGALCDAIRQRVLALPTRATPRVIGKAEADVLEILTEEAHDACGELAATELVGATKDRARRRASRGASGDEDPAEAGAPAKVDAQPVG